MFVDAIVVIANDAGDALGLEALQHLVWPWRVPDEIA